MEFLSLLALIIACVALLRGAFRTPPAPQVVYIAVPQAEPTASGAGCLSLIVAGLLILVLLGVIRF